MLLRIGVVAVLALAALANRASSAENTEHPLRPTPEKRAENFQEPMRTVHLSLARALHDSQVQEWGKAGADDPGLSRNALLVAVALALEEYYVMELSYPESVQQLLNSGYLDKARPVGLELVDFSTDAAQANDLTLVYIPQPIGRTALISVPGAGCGVAMRSYREYSLAVPTAHVKKWVGEKKLKGTNWLRPFYDLGVHDILLVNQVDPGATSCAGC